MKTIIISTRLKITINLLILFGRSENLMGAVEALLKISLLKVTNNLRKKFLSHIEPPSDRYYMWPKFSLDSYPKKETPL